MTFGLTRDLSTEIGALIASEIGKITIGALQGGSIVLGGGSGEGGGTGGPPGGFIGQLIQTRVAFDNTEESSLDIPSGILPYSGASLLDNLNRIRYWIDERVTISGLASTLPGSGASMVGVEDVGGYFDSDDVEAVLQELGVTITSGWLWHTFVFTAEGNLEVGSSPLRIYLPGDFTIDKVYISVNTPPTGSNIIVDVNKNSTTIFTTQANRPEITISGYTGESGIPDITSLSLNDYLTFDRDQIGSSIAGADLTVHVRCKQYIQTS